MTEDQLIEELSKVELTPENVAHALMHAKDERDMWKGKADVLMTRYSEAQDALEYDQEQHENLLQQIEDLKHLENIV